MMLYFSSLSCMYKYKQFLFILNTYTLYHIKELSKKYLIKFINMQKYLNALYWAIERANKMQQNT